MTTNPHRVSLPRAHPTGTFAGVRRSPLQQVSRGRRGELRDAIAISLGLGLGAGLALSLLFGWWV